jgi:hypothetical protein
VDLQPLTRAEEQLAQARREGDMSAIAAAEQVVEAEQCVISCVVCG